MITLFENYTIYKPGDYVLLKNYKRTPCQIDRKCKILSNGNDSYEVETYHYNLKKMVIVHILNNEIQRKLKEKGISVKYDNRTENKPGWKFAEYELKGVPIRIAIGARDLENQTVEIARRDNLTKETQPLENIEVYIENLLKTIQEDIYKKALNYREEHITEVNSYEEFKKVLEEKGGFISAHWDGTDEEEEQIKNETKATIRCIPLENTFEDGISLISKKPSKQRVIFAKAY